MCVCVLVCEWIGQREAVTQGELALQRNGEKDVSPGDDVLGRF